MVRYDKFLLSKHSLREDEAKAFRNWYKVEAIHASPSNHFVVEKNVVSKVSAAIGVTELQDTGSFRVLKRRSLFIILSMTTLSFCYGLEVTSPPFVRDYIG